MCAETASACSGLGPGSSLHGTPFSSHMKTMAALHKHEARPQLMYPHGVRYYPKVHALPRTITLDTSARCYLAQSLLMIPSHAGLAVAGSLVIPC